MICDMHVHTKDFSKDSVMKSDELLDFLKNNPKRIVCTTEHFDYDYKLHLPFDELKVDIDEYSLKFKSLKKKYENTHQEYFPILFGIEFGYLEHLGNFYNFISELRQFDCIINSVHCINNFDPYWDRSIYDSGKRKVYSDYLELIIKMFEISDSFDVVGHFDYISRYSPYEDKLMKYNDFPDYFDKIFSLCISKGKSFELNTKTCSVFRKTNPDIFFDENIIKRYKELGGVLISFGSDAHEFSQMFNLFDETKEILMKNNFKYIVHYSNRKPVFSRL